MASFRVGVLMRSNEQDPRAEGSVTTATNHRRARSRGAGRSARAADSLARAHEDVAEVGLALGAARLERLPR